MSKPKTQSKQSAGEQGASLYSKYTKLFPPGGVEFIQSGAITLDYAYGGGVPCGKTVLMSSSYGVGKSTICLFQAGCILTNDENAVVLYLDAERALTEELKTAILGSDYKRVFGERFVHLTPPTYEDVESIVLDYAAKGNLKYVVIDSVTTLLPREVLERKEGPGRIGAKSAAEAEFCLKMKIHCSVSMFAVIYVNQARANISMQKGSSDKATTKDAGGFVLHHSTDVHMSLWPKQYIYNAKGERVGCKAQVSCSKNRMVGNVSTYVFLKYGFGVSNLASVIDILKFGNKVAQAGSYFKIQIEEIPAFREGVNAQGNAGLEELVKENYPAILAYLKDSGLLNTYLTTYTI